MFEQGLKTRVQRGFCCVWLYMARNCGSDRDKARGSVPRNRDERA
jgi:hypothetical protein